MIVISVESSSTLFAVDHVKAILLYRFINYESYYMTHPIILYDSYDLTQMMTDIIESKPINDKSVPYHVRKNLLIQTELLLLCNQFLDKLQPDLPPVTINSLPICP